MSKYTTDEVLGLMEEWYEHQDGNEGFYGPFTGFDGLLCADLSKVDLGSGTIKQKAEEYRRKNPEKVEPPWKHRSGGIDLRGAILSREDKGPWNLAKGPIQPYVGLNVAFFSGANLQGACFAGAQLQGAHFAFAQLQGANFHNAKLQGATFMGAHLDGTYFISADLDRVDFPYTRLQSAHLYGTEFKSARLENVSWDDDYALGDDQISVMAEPVYRKLKQYYNGTGQYDLAGEFHKRELLMKRKSLWGEGIGGWRKASVLLASAVLMGHGERPSWVVGWVAVCFGAFALAYWLLNALPDGSVVESIRHSAQTMVSFGRRDDVARLAQDIALVQSLISYVLLALFLVTFVRKVSPR